MIVDSTTREMRRLLLCFQITFPGRKWCLQRCSVSGTPLSWNALQRSSTTKYLSGSYFFIFQGGGDGSNFQHPGGIRGHSTIAGANLQQFSSEHYQLYQNAATMVIESPEFKAKKKSLMKKDGWTQENFRRLERWLLQKKQLSKTETSTVEFWDGLRENWIAELSSNKNEANVNDKAGIIMRRKKMSSSLISHLAAQRNTLKCHIFKVHSLISESPPAPVATVPDPPQISQSLFQEVVQFVIQRLIDLCNEEKQECFLVAIPMVWQKMKEGGAVIKKTKSRRMLNNVEKSSSITSQFDCLTTQVALLEEMVMYHDLVFGEDQKSLLFQRYVSLLMKLSSLRIRRSQSIPYTEFGHHELVIASLIQGGLFRASTKTLLSKGTTGTASEVGDIYSLFAVHNAMSNKFGNANSNGMFGVNSNVLEWDLSTNAPAIHDTTIVNELAADRVGISETQTQQNCKSTLTQAQRKTFFDDILSLGAQQQSLTELTKFSNWLKCVSPQ